MAALNFVAIGDGEDNGPKLTTLARLLKVHRGLALWFLFRIRRMILDHGNHITGVLPKQYGQEDIASFLEFDGKARLLVDALRKQGYLGRKTGRGFHYPDWENTITGKYAAERERDRLWHLMDRANRRSDDVGRRSTDASTDGLTTSADISTGRKKGRESGRPPVPPPEGGQSLGALRWEWLVKNAPTPQNREVCTRILHQMTGADWLLVQWSYESKKKGGVNISRKNARTLDWPTDVFLRKTAFHRFAGYYRTFKEADQQPAKPQEAPAIETREEQMLKDWHRLEAYLSSDLWSDRKKEAQRDDYEKRWGCKPWQGDRPWEKTKKSKKGKRT